MADRMLFMSWGTTVRGAESQALEVFNETMGLLGRMQQDGRIESFDVALLEPNADLAGYTVIHGTGAQIAALRDDEEFQRNTAAAQMIVDDLRHIDGWTNDGVASRMALFQDAISRVPQRA